MNKALRFVWLSLLTLICGVASAGTVVFDPTQASDVTTGGGTTITKNGITLTITKQNPSWPISFDATKQDGKVCYTLLIGGIKIRLKISIFYGEKVVHLADF